MTLQKLLHRYKTNRPKDARQRCLLLRAITLARSPSDKAPGSYPKYPELKGVSATISSVCEVLLNAENDGLDINDLWQAMNTGLNWGLAKRMLFLARRDFEANPALSFKEHLKNNIADPVRSRTRDRSDSKKARPALGRTPNFSINTQAANDMTSTTTTKNGSKTTPEILSVLQAAGADAESKGLVLRTCSLIVEVMATQLGVQSARAHTEPKNVAVEPATPSKVAPAPPAKAQTTAPSAPPPAPKKKAAPKPKGKKRAVLLVDVQTGEKLDPLADRIAMAIGDRAVDRGTAISLLRALNRSWVPKSNDLKAYISGTLRNNPEVFDRVSRGVYRVTQRWHSQNPRSRAQYPHSVLENPFAAVAAE